MRVLVTGATGFIGQRVVADLLEHGYEVGAVVRHAPRPELPAEVEQFEGDVTDAASIHRAVQGVDGVFHLAAIYDFGMDEQKMRSVNVDGTRHVLDAAAAAGVGRVLFCGSDVALGNTYGVVVNEQHSSPSTPRSAYEQTKKEAHLLVVERQKAGASVVNALVSTVTGPNDKSPIGDLITSHAAGRLPFILDDSAGYTFSHVDDVAEGLRLVFERGADGQTYLLGGEPTTFGLLAKELAVRSGRPVPRVLPRYCHWAAPYMGILLGRSRAAMRELTAMSVGVTRFFDNSRASTELGFAPRSLAKTLDDTVPWYLDRERSAVKRSLRRTLPLLWFVAVLDLVLGGVATVAPTLYLTLFHGDVAGSVMFVQRTGALWLSFCAVQALAAIRRQPAVIAGVGLLRLVEVPADITYLATGTFTTAGAVGVVAAIGFNLTVGLIFLTAGLRGQYSSRFVAIQQNVGA